jgi:hypothetical protein
MDNFLKTEIFSLPSSLCPRVRIEERSPKIHPGFFLFLDGDKTEVRT